MRTKFKTYLLQLTKKEYDKLKEHAKQIDTSIKNLILIAVDNLWDKLNKNDKNKK